MSIEATTDGVSEFHAVPPAKYRSARCSKNREAFLTELYGCPFDELIQTFREYPKRGIRVFHIK